MSKLNDLIKELCPDGVDVKSVGEICDTITDYTAAGSFADIAKNVKYINDGIGYAQLIRTTDLKSALKNTEKFIYVSEHAFNYLWRVNLDSECLVLPNVGNCGEVYYVTPDILSFPNNVLGPNAILVKSSTVNNRYLFHAFQNLSFQKKLAKITSSTGQTKFNKTNFKALEIPIPPLPVQCEIVRILDNFTALISALISALTAELTAQRKRYSGLLNSLLSFEGRDAQDGVLWKKLGDIAVNLDSRRIAVTKHNRKAGIYPYYGASGIVDYVDDYIFDGDFLLVSEDGANLVARSTPIAFSITGKNWVNNHAHVLKFDNIYLQKYVEIYLNLLDLSPYISKGAQPKLSQTSLKKIILPIPDDSRIRYVVDILDRFDKLCNDLSEGLPAEIAARQKQYEYYRDKLLTFKEKKA